MNNTYLCHHGIKGQKWGVRRFEDEDGTLTDAGKARYNTGPSNRDIRKEYRQTRMDEYKRISKEDLGKNHLFATEDEKKYLEIASKKSAINKVVEKYGQETYNNAIKKPQQRLGAAATVGALGAVGGVALGIILKSR